MDWKELLAFAATTGLISLGGAYWMFQRFMEIQVKKVVAKYEAALRDKTEVLKTDLSIYAHETTIGLTRLEELRAKAIQDIYSILTLWQDRVHALTQPDLGLSGNEYAQFMQVRDRASSLQNVSGQLSTKVRDTALYFDEKSSEVIAAFCALVSSLSGEFYEKCVKPVEVAELQDYSVFHSSLDPERAALKSRFEDAYASAKGALVSEFRKLMKSERGSKAGE